MTSTIIPGFCQCGCGGKTKIAKWNDARKGQVKGQPLRFIHNHHRRLTTPQYIINETTGCWDWQHHITDKGYGRMWNGQKKVRAHRYFYEQKYGPIPNGLELDHLCRNRACVNPDHLEPVTTAENIRRACKFRREGGEAIRQTQN
ncbi:MAG: HNH endonuclease [Actinobacteria bacterium]|nr:HNH endonuclease [Actinomycetota bacterium]